MSIPEERLPEADETFEDPTDEIESPDMIVEDEQESLESADADYTAEEVDEDDDGVERDTAGFGFGDPAD